MPQRQTRRRSVRRSIKPVSKPRLMTLAEVISETGVPVGQFQMAAKAGCVVQTVRGRYEESATLRGIIKYLWGQVGKLPIYENAGQCSAATGIPIATILKAKRVAKLGASNNNLNLELLLKAMFKSSGENWDEMEKEYAAKEKKRLHDEKMGVLVPKSEMEHAAKRGVGVVFRLLDQRSNVDLPPALVGLDAAGIQRELVKSDDELKANLVAEWSVLMRNGESKNGETK